MNLSTLVQRIVSTSALLLLMLFSTKSYADIIVKVVRLEVQINQTLYYNFEAECVPNPPEIEYHNDNPNFGSAFLDDGTNTPAHYGSCNVVDDIHELKYIPNVSQVNRDTLYLAYDKKDENNLVQEYFDIIIIDIVNHSLKAHNDYATTIVNQPVEIDVLANDDDYGANSDLYVSFIALANHEAECTITNDNTILFTPRADFSGVASFDYTVCFDNDSCDVATVFVGVDNQENEEIFHQAHYNYRHKVYNALDGYTVISGPSIGDFTQEPDGYYTYSPGPGSTDNTVTVTLENNSGTIKTLIFDVQEHPNKKVLTKEDNIWVCENDFIEFSVSENDLVPYMVLNTYSNPTYGDLEYVGNGDMVYTVNEDVQAKKRDAATYLAAAFGWKKIETNIINIHIDEFVPKNTTYNLTTKKNVPLILEYKTFLKNPISLSEELPPSLGGLMITNDPYTFGSQTEPAGLKVVYVPATDLTYDESFKLSYDPGSGNKYTIIVNVTVEESSPNDELDCIGENCVWPGDMDRNGIVDGRDYLMLGYGIGAIGEARADGADNSWAGQYAESWDSPVYGTPIDYKFLDANGDGRVDFNDTVAINQNYSKENSIYPRRKAEIANVNVQANYGEGLVLQSAPLIFIGNPNNPPNPTVGDVLTADVWLGYRESPVIDIHGISWTMPYDTTRMDASSVSINFLENSWFTHNSTVLSQSKSPENGFLDAAISRTRANGISGFGKIGRAEFIIITDVNGVKSDKTEMVLALEDITVMNGDGTINHYPSTSISIPIYTGNTEHIDPTLVTYPNPSQGIFNLHLNGGMDKIIESYEVFSLDGKLVKSNTAVNAKSDVLNMTGYTTGIYIVKAITTEGVVVNSKIEVVE